MKESYKALLQFQSNPPHRTLKLRSFDHGGVGEERLNCRFKRCAKNKDLHSVLYQCSVQSLILNSNSIGAIRPGRL